MVLMKIQYLCLFILKNQHFKSRNDEERANDTRRRRAVIKLYEQRRRRAVVVSAQEGGAPPLREELPPLLDEQLVFVGGQCPRRRGSSPTIKRGHISADEEDLIIRLHRLLGNRWSLIAGRIPGRTDNEIKNYWNTHLSKKLISQGIDPKTHKQLSSSSPNQPEAISPNSRENISNSIPTDPNNGPGSDDVLSRSPGDLFASFLDSLINEEMCNQQTSVAQSK